MKIQSLLNQLKSVKNLLKGMRLIVVLVIVAALLVGATSVAVYAMSQQKKQIPVAEKVQEKLANPALKEEQKVPVAAEEKAITLAPTSTQPAAPAPQGIPAPTKPVAERSKPITVQVAWWGGAYIYNDQDTQVVRFGSTAVRIVGFIGGELHWQAEANINGVISVINSGSATLAPKQGTYDIPQFDNRELLYTGHTSDILLRVHITSPNDVATEWRAISYGTF
jgi:hypothetical protein